MPSNGYQDYPVQLSPGIGASDFMLGPAFSQLDAPAGAAQDGLGSAVAVPAFQAPKASPMWWLLGLLGLVIAVHFIHRESRRRAGKEVVGSIDDAVGINLWNFLSTGIMSALFILTLKIGANKWAAGSTFAAVATAI